MKGVEHLGNGTRCSGFVVTCNEVCGKALHFFYLDVLLEIWTPKDGAVSKGWPDEGQVSVLFAL